MDKLEELEMKIKELSNELERLKKEKENELWKPKIGEWYWFVDSEGLIHTTEWSTFHIHRQRYLIGNVFRTQEEAEFRAEQLKVEAELRRFARPFIAYKHNFILTYNHLRDEIFIECSIYTQYTNLHFPSEEITQKRLTQSGRNGLKNTILGWKIK